MDRNRQYKRIEKILTILYCVPDELPKKWDMSVVKNISAGGVMFLVPGDVDIKGKIVQLRIGIPELAPHVLELDALALDTKACYNPKISEVRAKFVNVSEADKKHLAVIEEIIKKQEMRNSSDIYGKKPS